MPNNINDADVSLNTCNNLHFPNSIMKGKILITGASGFIGSFLVEEALHMGFEVFAGIRASSNKQFLTDEKIYFAELDLSSQEILQEQLVSIKQMHGSFDYVIHNAGITHADNKKDFFTVNCNYTQNLLHALQRSGMQIKKFVLISSLAAYGPGNAKTFAPIELWHEQIPISTYAKSKFYAEEFIRSSNIFPYLIINPTAVYGPRDKDFLQFIQLLNKGIEPYIGNNQQMVSLVYVKDLAKAVVGLMDSRHVNYSYIVSDRNDYNKEELGATVKLLLNKRTIKIKIPLLFVRPVVSIVEKLSLFFFDRLPFLHSEKLEEISCPNWLCDSDQLWNDLHLKPGYSLEAGMKETIGWYKENKWI